VMKMIYTKCYIYLHNIRIVKWCNLFRETTIQRETILTFISPANYSLTENNCHDNNLETIVYRTVREINSKSGIGALLHPAEEYFIEQVASRLSN